MFDNGVMIDSIVNYSLRKVHGARTKKQLPRRGDPTRLTRPGGRRWAMATMALRAASLTLKRRYLPPSALILSKASEGLCGRYRLMIEKSNRMNSSSGRTG